MPEECGDGEPDEEFVKRSGVHSLDSRNQPVWKTHAPRKRSRNAIISIAREQAANAADGVADSCRRRTDIQKFEQRNFQPARQNDERNKSAQKTAKPGETIAAEELRPRVCKELMRTLKNVVKPGASQTGKPSDSDDQKSFVLFVSCGNTL